MALKLERDFTETRPDLIIISIFGAFQIFDSNNSIDSRGMEACLESSLDLLVWHKKYHFRRLF